MNIFSLKKKFLTNFLPAWKNAQIAIIIVGVFTLMDATTLYSCFEKLMVEKVFMSILLTFVLALVLNIIPAIIAVLIVDENSLINRIIVVLLLMGFLALFIFCFALRWSGREIFYSTDSISLLINGQENLQNDTTNQSGRDLLAVIMGLEPLLTSMVSFSIMYENPKKKRERLLTLELYKYEEKKKECEVRLRELELELQRDFEGEEEKKYNEFLDMLEAQEQLNYIMVREELAKRLKDADSISRLMQEE